MFVRTCVYVLKLKKSIIEENNVPSVRHVGNQSLVKAMY